MVAKTETTKSTKLNIMGKSENFILTNLKGKGVFSRAFRVMELDGRKGRESLRVLSA